MSFVGSSPTTRTKFAPLVQLVETSRLEREGSRFESEGEHQVTECGSVADRLVWDQDQVGSIPTTPTNVGGSSMVERQIVTLEMRVRFPSVTPLFPLRLRVGRLI